MYLASDNKTPFTPVFDTLSDLKNISKNNKKWNTGINKTAAKLLALAL